MSKKLETLGIKSPEHLSRWLGVEEGELKQIARNTDSHCYEIERQTSSGKKRLIFNADRKLKSIQCRIKDRILDRVPVSDSAHAWTKGRSPLTNATQHIGKDVVVKLDIKDFFPSIHYSRVYKLFISLGCSPDVSRILTQLTTYNYHLPQGTHTSPAIANLILKDLDSRLKRLSSLHGITYTRYGDDISISGKYSAEKLKNLLRKIIKQEGFTVETKKIKVQHKHQRQEVTGIVVNKIPNIPKEKREKLMGIIRNCQRYGPSTQTTENKDKFRRRLLGLISYVKPVNPKLGTKLQKEFGKIDWSK